MLAAGAIVGTLNLSATYPQLATYNLTTDTIAVLLEIFGAVALVLGVLELGVGIGFLGGKGWAWTVGIIVGIINIVTSIPSIYFFGAGNIVGLVFWGIIVYYLTRPHVKAFFGKGQMPVAGMPAPTQPATM